MQLTSCSCELKEDKIRPFGKYLIPNTDCMYDIGLAMRSQILVHINKKEGPRELDRSAEFWHMKR